MNILLREAWKDRECVCILTEIGGLPRIEEKGNERLRTSLFSDIWGKGRKILQICYWKLKNLTFFRVIVGVGKESYDIRSQKTHNSACILLLKKEMAEMTCGWPENREKSGKSSLIGFLIWSLRSSVSHTTLLYSAAVRTMEPNQKLKSWERGDNRRRIEWGKSFNSDFCSLYSFLVLHPAWSIILARTRLLPNERMSAIWKDNATLDHATRIKWTRPKGLKNQRLQ